MTSLTRALLGQDQLTMADKDHLLRDFEKWARLSPKDCSSSEVESYIMFIMPSEYIPIETEVRKFLNAVQA